MIISATKFAEMFNVFRDKTRFQVVFYYRKGEAC